VRKEERKVGRNEGKGREKEGRRKQEMKYVS